MTNPHDAVRALDERTLRHRLALLVASARRPCPASARAPLVEAQGIVSRELARRARTTCATVEVPALGLNWTQGGVAGADFPPRRPVAARMARCFLRIVCREWQTIALWAAPLAAAIYLVGHLSGVWP